MTKRNYKIWSTAQEKRLYFKNFASFQAWSWNGYLAMICGKGLDLFIIIIINGFFLERERKHWFVAIFIYVFIGWLLYMPWQGFELATWVYKHGAQTNWVTQPGPGLELLKPNHQSSYRTFSIPTLLNNLGYLPSFS